MSRHISTNGFHLRVCAPQHKQAASKKKEIASVGRFFFLASGAFSGRRSAFTQSEPPAKKSLRPSCLTCGEPMRFMIVKAGSRKFQCIKGDDTAAMQVPDFQAWTNSDMRPPKRTRKPLHAISRHRIRNPANRQSLWLEMVIRARRVLAENWNCL